MTTAPAPPRIPPVKPPTPAPASPVPQSRDPHSIRFSPTEWAGIEAAARARGIEPSRYARRLCLMGLSMEHARASMEGAARDTA